VRERAVVHVGGPRHSGKTTFVERVLDADVAFSICVRGERDPALRKQQVSAEEDQPELRRYRESGAAEVGLYRFAERSIDEFFMSDFMQNYSEAVFIEGDLPFDFVDLSVFIAPIPANGQPLLRRIQRYHAAARAASLAGPTLIPREHWALAEGYAGIERAQVVVANIRDESEQPAAVAFLEEVAQLRNDATVFADVMGYPRSKLPITAVAADLSNPKDAGLKKALARVKRATRQRR